MSAEPAMKPVRRSTGRPHAALIRKAAVLGAGTMGSRIAAHLANAGLPVVLLDLPSDGPRAARLRRRRWTRSRRASRRRSSIPRLPARITCGNFDDDLALLAGLRLGHRGGDGEPRDQAGAAREDRAAPEAGRDPDHQHQRPAGRVDRGDAAGGSCGGAGSARTSSIRRATCGWWRSSRRRRRIRRRSKRSRISADRAAGQGSGVRARHAELHRQPHRRLHHAGSGPADAGGGSHHRRGGRADRHRDRLAAHRDLPAGRHGGPRRAGARGGELRTAASRRRADGMPPFVRTMLERRWLGDKTSRASTRRRRTPRARKSGWCSTGRRWSIIPRDRPKLPSLEMAKNAEQLPERLRQLLAGDVQKDKAARFHWRLLSALWNYAADCLPEIADDAASVDRAMRAGFNWEMGPFELWDAAGVRGDRGAHGDAGEPVSPIVETPAGRGRDAWYRDHGRECFDLDSGALPAGRRGRGHRARRRRSARRTAWCGRIPARRWSIWATAWLPRTALEEERDRRRHRAAGDGDAARRMATRCGISRRS